MTKAKELRHKVLLTEPIRSNRAGGNKQTRRFGLIGNQLLRRLSRTSLTELRSSEKIIRWSRRADRAKTRVAFALGHHLARANRVGWISMSLKIRVQKIKKFIIC
ncbi:hypothetical protein L596_023452 [Steinernema carpocapsae]|uniref:Uncharacterized protein n=1 Tax=Steinernema carpocapsae TaxID=34508 RepID=A0A4V5ZZG1_STECR|nr:hypothetical protein L596_023452 [Steinernema carpocapsae]